jgi:hypothetical protein
MINEPDQTPDNQPFDAIEDQKTRLWAMAFESKNQIVNCTNCGAISVVPRLVENPEAVPERQENFAPFPAITMSVLPHPVDTKTTFEPATPAKKVEPVLASNKDQTIKALSILSATLAVSLAAVLVGSYRKK